MLLRSAGRRRAPWPGAVVWSLVLAAFGVGCGSSKVELTGALQKGPFLRGSTVTVTTVDRTGTPQGQVFPIQTRDDTGAFDLSLLYRGAISIEGSGYFWNEITGLSDAPLKLHAFGEVTAAPHQSVNVNLFNHLCYGRVKSLLAGSHPPSVGSAIAQAERELREGLMIGGAGFDPHASGMQMSLAGGDTDGNAYLFALSSIFAQMAEQDASARRADGTTVSSTAALKDLIDRVASGFAVDGQIDSALVSSIRATEAQLSPAELMARLGARLTAAGSSAAVPQLGRVWDGDGDGVPDHLDDCPLYWNPDQGPVNGLCRATFLGAERFGIAVGDMNEDGKPDLIEADDVLTVWVNDGSGHFDTSISSALSPGAFDSGPGGPMGRYAGASEHGSNPSMWVGDVDKDGHNDLVTTRGDGVTALFAGDGSGHFGQGIPILPQPVAQPCVSIYDCPPAPTLMLYQPFVADFDGDGLNDVLGMAEGVWLAWGTSPRSWAPAIKLTGGYDGPVVADVNGDHLPDVITATEVRLSTGSRSTPFTVLPLTNAPGLPAAAFDYDRNGTLDLVATGSAGLQVMPGDGMGHFGAPVNLAAILPTTQQVFVGDFTGDGQPDLLYNFDIIVVADGTQFRPSRPIPVAFDYPPGGTPDRREPLPSVLVADMNGDGTADLVFKRGSATLMLVNPK